MSNILKLKIGASSFSILLLITIPIYDSKFYADETYTRWEEQLTWDDFKGWVKPFTGWGASIGSTVYLEKDSLSNSFKSYAAMNNIQSWTKTSTTNSEYALNHEQYHFNITEFHARKMNEYIKSFTGLPDKDYYNHLEKIRYEQGTMQDRYDRETDHSLIRDKQRRWEFKIDSMLVQYSDDKGWFVDQFTGAKIFSPVIPRIEKGSNPEHNSYRVLSFIRYDMYITLASDYYPYLGHRDSLIIDMLDNAKNFESRELVNWNIDSSGNELTFLSKHKGIEYKRDYLTKEILDRPYIFTLTANYPNNTADTTGYYQIAQSIFDSFTRIKTDDYWKEYLSNSETIFWYSSEVKESNTPDSNSLSCYVSKDEYINGCFSGPILRENETIMFVSDLSLHADSLISEKFVLANERFYRTDSKNDTNIFIIPIEHFQDDKLSVKIGYTLFEDSIHECNQYYYQRIDLKLPIKHK